MKVLRCVTICFTLLFCLTNTQCEDDDCCSPNPEFCETQLIIDDELYNQEPLSLVTINNVSVQGDCLIFDFSASGCSGDSWEYDVVFSTAVAESLPVQRFARFNFVNNESCLAVFSKEASFDLTVFQQFNENPIIINLEGWEGELLYEY